MAKFTPSLAGDIRGSMGGVTFSKNRNGNYIRRRVAPVNPMTAAQQTVRARLDYLAQYWNTTLSDSERLAFNTQGSLRILTDNLGQSYNLSGQQLFISLNAVNLACGKAIEKNAPAPAIMPVISTSALTVTADDTPTNRALDLDLTGTLALGGDLMFYMTAPVSPGRTFIKPGEYRLVQTAASDTIPATVDLLANWEAIFGALSAASVGQKIHIKIVPVDANGYQGSPWVDSGTGGAFH